MLFSLVGSLPYLISGTIPSFVNAIFESVSGFTTTGASILTDVEVLPYSILFWRSLTHWIGGIGIIVLVILILPTLKVTGYHLFSLESSMKEKIHPRTTGVVYRILLIYIGITVLEIVFLVIGRHEPFRLYLPFLRYCCHRGILNQKHQPLWLFSLHSICRCRIYVPCSSKLSGLLLLHLKGISGRSLRMRSSGFIYSW